MPHITLPPIALAACLASIVLPCAFLWLARKSWRASEALTPWRRRVALAGLLFAAAAALGSVGLQVMYVLHLGTALTAVNLLLCTGLCCLLAILTGVFANGRTRGLIFLSAVASALSVYLVSNSLTK